MNFTIPLSLLPIIADDQTTCFLAAKIMNDRSRIVMLCDRPYMGFLKISPIDRSIPPEGMLT